MRGVRFTAWSRWLLTGRRVSSGCDYEPRLRQEQKFSEDIG